jgi:hypothetical protein
MFLRSIKSNDTWHVKNKQFKGSEILFIYNNLNTSPVNYFTDYPMLKQVVALGAL